MSSAIRSHNLITHQQFQFEGSDGLVWPPQVRESYALTNPWLSFEHICARAPMQVCPNFNLVITVVLHNNQDF
jgi:hypothetical protein